MQVRNRTHSKVAPPVPDASPKPPPPLRIELSDLLLLSQDTREKHSRIFTIARGLIIYISLSRDTTALHVYKTHDRIPSSVGGINTSSRRIYTRR